MAGTVNFAKKVVIHLGNDQHGRKACQSYVSLPFHIIGRSLAQDLGVVGAGAVYHHQAEHGQEDDGKQQAVIIKTPGLFLFGLGLGTAGFRPSPLLRMPGPSAVIYRLFTHSLKIRPRSS